MVLGTRGLRLVLAAPPSTAQRGFCVPALLPLPSKAPGLILVWRNPPCALPEDFAFSLWFPAPSIPLRSTQLLWFPVPLATQVQPGCGGLEGCLQALLGRAVGGNNLPVMNQL